MDKEERKQRLFDTIQQLENDGLVDWHFRDCYQLKEDSGSRFFLDLISTFSGDFKKVAKKMAKILHESPVDCNEMNECRFKIQGSAACIGACRISAVCSNSLHQAIENNSKEECLQAMENLWREFKIIQYLWNPILRGLVDFHFRECYLLKEDTDPTFFFELISNFSTDARKVIIDRNQSLVDFDEMIECCIKLKGSAACIGACRISAVCSNLHQAVENDSKEGCLQALNNIKHEFKKLQSRLNVVLEVEHKLISGIG